MSEEAAYQAYERARARTIELYLISMGLLLVGIGVLIVYSISLGTLVGPGVNQSFGYAVALILVMGALLAHLIDRTYRVWPLGRRTVPPPASVITDQTAASFLKVIVVVAAGAAIAYVLGTLVAG